MEILSIKMPKIYYGSQFESILEPTERLINLCKQTSCDEIIIGVGGSLDIHNLSILD